MDSRIEKLTNEIDSLQRQVQSNTQSLSTYREDLEENQSTLKNLHNQHRELGIQMGKIIEQCEKIQKQIKEKTAIIQNAEKNLVDIQQKLVMRENQYKQNKAQLDEEHKEFKKFLKTRAGSLYQQFIAENPQYKNINRWTYEEWGNYCISCGVAFESKWNEYKQKVISYPNHVEVQKTGEQYFTESRKNNNGWTLHTCMEVIQSKHGEEASKNWHLVRILQGLTFPPFPKFVFQPPCTNALREAKTWQSQDYYENCYNWFENNKQHIENTIENVKKNEEDAKRAVANRIEEERKATEEGIQNTITFKDFMIKAFLERVENKITSEEAETILAKYYEPQNGTAKVDPRHPYLSQNVFKQDSLLAMKVCNRFAQEHVIRVEDAMNLFKEYAIIHYTLPKEPKVLVEPQQQATNMLNPFGMQRTYGRQNGYVPSIGPGQYISRRLL